VHSTIILFLIHDGITNGAIYALLGIALVLVFAVTRVIFIPQGEFVAFGALTYALLESGKLPGTVWLLVGFGITAFLFDMIAMRRSGIKARRLAGAVFFNLVLPSVATLAAFAIAGQGLGAVSHFVLTVVLITLLGPLLYRIAYKPIADASVLTLLIASVGVHLALVGLGLVFFGAEGLRAPAMSNLVLPAGPVLISGQSLAVYFVTVLAIASLWLFFERTLWGKALRATAVNRHGARLVGIRTGFAGMLAFGLAAAIGAISGILVSPMTTVYYDTGFLIGLKGFVAAIIGGLASHPLTALAALVVGIVESFASFFVSGVKEIVVFSLIIPVLLWRSLTHTHVEEEE
jgi:branched-chain amino acid transport system permease protein